jgi:enoyl-CoA hydratase/carnithine racemase
MSYQHILYEIRDRIATVTLNRPDRMNAWTPTMERDVRHAMQAAAADDDVRVIVLTGAGRAFCAGADMDALNGSKITATVRGGDGDGAVKTVQGIEQLLEFITAGGNYSAESPGVPIAYKLAYLDNAPARLAVTMEYPEVSCQ